jgi:nucleoside phosphorylase
VLLRYSPSDHTWADSLAYFVKHIGAISGASSVLPRADVVILTALEDPEFSAIRTVFPELSGPRSLDEKTLYWEGEISIGGHSLRIVAGYSWQMGLTAAAVLASKFISAFKPKIIAMTGICAGFEDDIALGDVIVATQSWEWQGGKLKDSADGTALAAAPEPYRASRTLVTDLHALSANTKLIDAVTREFFPRDIGSTWKVHFGPMVSGLSVVASSTVMAEVKTQHRKMLGLEMEAYAIYAAAEFNAYECQRIVIKGACDFGSAEKSDNFQNISALRSALTLRSLLTENIFKYSNLS